MNPPENSDHRFQLWFSMLDLSLDLAFAGLRAQGETGLLWDKIAERWEKEDQEVCQAHLRFFQTLAKHGTSQAA